MLAEHDIAFLPSGAMNTALAIKLRERGRSPILWCHSQESLDYIRRHDESKNLPGVRLHGMAASTSLEEVLEGKKIIIFSPRSWDLRQDLRDALPYIEPDALIVCCSKGFDEHQGKFFTPSQVIEQEVPSSRNRSAFLAGPNFAGEIARGVITGTVVTSYNKKVAQTVKDLFNHREDKDFLVEIYKGKPPNVEVVAAFKNVVALVFGFARTLERYGENTGAYILTEGLREARILCKAMKCKPDALDGLCGIGDLALLPNSLSSRNVLAGYNFGKGVWDLDYLLDQNHTFEGVRTVRAVRELTGKRFKRMSLAAYAYAIIYERMDPRQAVEDLLNEKFPEI